jgi:hypothetical protein
MKSFKVIEQGQPVTIDDIRALAKALDAELPQAYIEFLLKYNGGKFVEDTFALEESREYVDRFCRIEQESYDDILQTTTQTYKNRIPKDCIIIAKALGGNLVCLSVKGKDYGKVYFWDHNFEAGDNEKPTRRNLHLIAKSFEEFTDGLYNSDDENELGGVINDYY